MASWRPSWTIPPLASVLLLLWAHGAAAAVSPCVPPSKEVGLVKNVSPHPFQVNRQGFGRAELKANSIVCSGDTIAPSDAHGEVTLSDTGQIYPILPLREVKVDELQHRGDNSGAQGKGAGHASIEARGMTEFASTASTAAGETGPRSPSPCFFNCYRITGKTGVYIAGLDPHALEGQRRMAQARDLDVKGIADSASRTSASASIELDAPSVVKRVDVIVERLRGAIRKAWPDLDPGPVHVRILGASDYAANARPDNTIEITWGLLQAARSDDEVAWVISHELAHLALGHFALDAAAEKRRFLLAAVVDLSVLQFEQKRLLAGGVGSGSPASKDQLTREEAARAGSEAFRQILALNGAALSRDQEDAADVAGADFALAAGYDAPEGATVAYQRIQAADNARVQQATALFQKSLVDASTPSPEAVNGLNRGDLSDFSNLKGIVASGLLDRFMGRMVAQLTIQHRTAAQREQGLTTYIRNAYGILAERPVATDWIDPLHADPSFAAAGVMIRARERALIMLADGKAQDALDTLRPILNRASLRTPFIGDLAAAAYAANGRPELADRIYDLVEGALPLRDADLDGILTEAMRQQPEGAPRSPATSKQTLEGYIAHVDLVVAAKHFAKAKALIFEAERKFGDHDPFLPALITIAASAPVPAEVTTELHACRMVEDDAIWARCRQAVTASLDSLKTRLSPSEIDKLQADAVRAPAEPDPRLRLLLQDTTKSTKGADKTTQPKAPK